LRFSRPAHPDKISFSRSFLSSLSSLWLNPPSPSAVVSESAGKLSPPRSPRPPCEKIPCSKSASVHVFRALRGHGISLCAFAPLRPCVNSTHFPASFEVRVEHGPKDAAFEFDGVHGWPLEL